MIDLRPHMQRVLPLVLGLVAWSGSQASPSLALAQVRFQPRVIDADSQHHSVAAMDVNQDGKLDIITGGWWYEAPTWQKHKVREVEMIRGRFDDYSCNPLDINGDGWTDLISICWDLVDFLKGLQQRLRLKMSCVNSFLRTAMS